MPCCCSWRDPWRLRAADDSAGLALFEPKIRPVLVKECYSCHSAGAKSIKGGLRLDSRAAVREGGESGPIVVPGKPDESPILEALRHEGLAMPPKGKLPDAVIADFERWIKIGAPDPRDGAAAAPARDAGPIDIEAGRQFWAYQPPRASRPPDVRDVAWPSTDIDRFVLAGLEARGLHPAADADRATLARRLSFDLIGLPPPPEEVDAFVTDPAPDAYERLVDRLLASPAFGERWGRHWLDVVRFGESLTLRGFVFTEAWRYRDYVIDAFNADMPFDRFVREQIAGDLLAADSPRRPPPAARRHDVPHAGQHQPRRAGQAPARHGRGRRAARHDRQGLPRPDDRLRPLPRPQVRPDPDEGLLRPGRHPPQRQGAGARQRLEVARGAAARRARGEEAEIQRARDGGRRRSRRGSRQKPRPRPRRAGRRARAVADRPGDVPGVVVDDAQAKKVGDWKESHLQSGTYIGAGYLHDDNAGKGEKTLTFQPELPEAGPYEVWLAYSPGGEPVAGGPGHGLQRRRREDRVAST